MYSLKFTGVSRRAMAFVIDIIIVGILTYLFSSFFKIFFLMFGGVKGTDFFE